MVLKSTHDHIQAWSRMKRYLKELDVWMHSQDFSEQTDKWQRRAYYERERVQAWILDSEKMIQIQFIEIPESVDWGGESGY